MLYVNVWMPKAFSLLLDQTLGFVLDFKGQNGVLRDPFPARNYNSFGSYICWAFLLLFPSLSLFVHSWLLLVRYLVRAMGTSWSRKQVGTHSCAFASCKSARVWQNATVRTMVKDSGNKLHQQSSRRGAHVHVPRQWHMKQWSNGARSQGWFKLLLGGVSPPA